MLFLCFCFFGHLLSVLHEFLHVASGSSLLVYELVVELDLALGMRLELNELLERNSVSASTTVEPKFVDHLLIDFIGLTHGVVVELQSHVLTLSDKLELTSQIRDLQWVKVQDHLKELSSITSALIEVDRIHGCSADEDVG